VTALEDPDPPIGFVMDSPYRTHVTPFPPGALLVLTTDGILDAMRGDEAFGEERLRKTILRVVTQPAATIAQDIYAAARRFAGGPLGDDAALAVVRRTA
jgi:serine phosphatase RsbU (regulator of sigma subunit)